MHRLFSLLVGSCAGRFDYSFPNGLLLESEVIMCNASHVLFDDQAVNEEASNSIDKRFRFTDLPGYKQVIPHTML